MLHLNGLNRHKVVVLETATPHYQFDGYENFCPNGWDSDRHNQAMSSLKKGWSLFEICETTDGRYFHISSNSVVEFTQKNGVRTHPSTSAMFWARSTVKVHTVAARGFELLYLIDSHDWEKLPDEPRD